MNRVDQIRPDAPALGTFGAHPVGVRTLKFTNHGQPDIRDPSQVAELGDRALSVELWYPAQRGTQQGGTYSTMIRDGQTRVTLQGSAARNASAGKGPYPLVLISHGYPGNRYLMSPLAEVLASHGFVVAAIDHAGSTYADQLPLASTLYHRPLDLRFVLDRLAAGGATLDGAIDCQKVGIVGYSMGGYGALVFGGAAISPEAVTHETAPAGGLLARHAEGNAAHADLVDPRVAAIVAFGPYGRNVDVWRPSGLAKMEKPLLVIAGDRDDISGYAAMRAIWAECGHPERHLLTFHNAGHNAGAPMPAPAESYAMSKTLGWPPFEHYADPVWDTVRMNNIAAHACVAMLSAHLKGDTQTGAQLADLRALAGLSLESTAL